MTRNFFTVPLLAAAVAASVPAATKPKLILAVVIDQFRYDYLTRFRSSYTGGLSQLLAKGSVFTNAHYDHFPTVTAIGHSTFMSGATPAISGIIANDWFDRGSGKTVTSVTDKTTKILGGKGEGGASPRRLLVSTLGDELKIANGNTRVIGISLKDRSAILPAGHMADGAYWFDGSDGTFVSSNYYFPDLPGWVRDFNAARPADKYVGAEWKSGDGKVVYKKMAPTADAAFYKSIPATPYSNELIEAFSERAISAEHLGRHDSTDLLAVSFSGNDYVGHDFGPDSPQVRDMAIRVDHLLGELFQYLDKEVGMANVVVVLTADHGGAPIPEVSTARKMPGGRMTAGVIQSTVQTKLTEQYGEGKWVISPSEHSLYLNLALMLEKKLNQTEVIESAADAALTIPHVFRAYTRDQLSRGGLAADQIGRRVFNGFYGQRGPDIMVLLEPNWLFGAKGTTHGTGFGYDTHVPIIFMGPGIKAGSFHQRIAPNDVAPTLATLLAVETPNGSVGRVLDEIFLRD